MLHRDMSSIFPEQLDSRILPPNIASTRCMAILGDESASLLPPVNKSADAKSGSEHDHGAQVTIPLS